ncbi:hypothetical protein HETIRDRAFT_162959 [Heterobasidion irregulare TC 32-1]|uniref:Uncharacterized protein n=1 Tax=Heterobasidion irregulare (strain TC 32-1) TaxID=747525 RepID=W4JRV4_HETIT|nr:uncharacterized protein HETIRDRAFT_162959 [Heterobasidion irregulare TC 32-1]ETW76204.1 hypothetical protein HETIRDRAFT_162959 [Heterobasidion irregulare TC 32-1]
MNAVRMVCPFQALLVHLDAHHAVIKGWSLVNILIVLGHGRRTPFVAMYHDQSCVIIFGYRIEWMGFHSLLEDSK